MKNMVKSIMKVNRNNFYIEVIIHMKYSIPLSDENKTLIAKSISDACKDNISDFKMEFDLATYNCIHNMKSDFISTNLRDNFNKELENSNIRIINFNVSWYEPPIIYDKNTNYLYSFTSKENFFKQKNGNNRSHYLYALASINKGIEPKHIMEQICLFEEDTKSYDRKITKTLTDIQQKINGPIKQYVLITYTNESFGLNSITAYIPTANLDIAYEESWNEYIVPSYEIVPISVVDDTNQEETKEIPLAIRKEFLVNNDEENDILKLRKDNKIDKDKTE